jgi:hypothetical protein
MGSRTQYPAFQGGDRRVPKLGLQRVLMRNLVRLDIAYHAIWCLYIDSHPSSIPRCTCLTVVHRECLSTRLHPSCGLHQVACELMQVVLCCPARPRRCCRSYSKPGSQRLHSKGRGGHNHHEKSLTGALERWRQAMNNMSQYDHT